MQSAGIAYRAVTVAQIARHYNYFRDYDASLGRYIESDPIGLRGGRNTFSYVSSRPLDRIDPFGLKRVMFWLLKRSWVEIYIPRYFLADKEHDPAKGFEEFAHEISRTVGWADVDDDCTLDHVTHLRFSSRGAPRLNGFSLNWLEINVDSYFYKKACGSECALRNMEFGTIKEHWAGGDGDNWDDLRFVPGGM